MKVGFFDSGLGARFVMEEFQKLFPEIPMVCFSDTQNCPYGDKDPSIIRELTFRGVQKLFKEEKCDVVILACNTAAAVSIRWLQQEAMVDRHILSVTIPGVEAIENAPIGKISVLATTRTSQSHVYKDLIHAKFPEREVEEIACPGLVEFIERGEEGSQACQKLLQMYLQKVPQETSIIILGCTHYVRLLPSIEKLLPDIFLINPGKEAAIRFSGWLLRHCQLINGTYEIKQRYPTNSTGPI